MGNGTSENVIYFCYYKTKSLGNNHVRVFLPRRQTCTFWTLKWFRFMIANHVLRHMCNLHIKETEISQKRSNGIKNWKITYSVILSILSNKTNLILGYSSPLIDHGEQPMKMQSRYRIKKNIISHAIVPTNQHGRRRMGGRYHQKY